jgi:hypothetical protein
LHFALLPEALLMAFTYDVTTNRGKVRLLTTDANSTSYTFEDAEIDAFIAMAPANLYVAAALAVETWARTRAKIATTTRNSDGSAVVRPSMSELLRLAKSLREFALSGALVTDTWDISTPNELLDSYRPEWRNITDIPVVE